MSRIQSELLPKESTIGPNELALCIAGIIDERQGMDVVILDVTGPLVIADFFVIATVRNDRHGNALARELIQTLKATAGRQRRNAAGLDADTGWVLLYFDDVVVHLFVAASRDFYDLENLWSDAPRIPFEPAVLLPTELLSTDVMPTEPLATKRLSGENSRAGQATFPDGFSGPGDAPGSMGTH